MPLFSIPSRAGREQDKSIASRTKETPKAKKKLGVLDRINSIKATVDSSLGKFRDDYIVIRDEDTLASYIQKAIDNDVIAIDTETTGLDVFDDELVGICIYTPCMKAAYIPVNHVSYITREKLDNQLPIDILSEQFALLSNTKIIMFNANFDLRVLKHSLDVYLTCYWDCYLAARLLNENEGLRGSGLKALHKKYVLDNQEDEFSYEAMFSGMTFNLIPIDYAYLYGAHDAIITYELYDFQRQYLSLDSPREDMRLLAEVFFNIEMPCVEVVEDMEDTGITFDLAYNQELSVKYNKLLEEKRQEYYKELEKYKDKIELFRKTNSTGDKLDNPINVDSPSQLAILLYDILKVPTVDEKKPRGTGVDILNRIDLPIAKVIAEYREFAKLVDAFISKLPLAVKKDGKIHCTLNQYGADTGRMSCENPNLQQIPSHNKDMRKMFTAREGYVLMSSDYSQQEVKVMAQMCGDEKMLQAFRQGKDFYAEIASVSFNKPYEDCLEFYPGTTTTNVEGKDRRTSAKSILLGINYGRGTASIAEQLHCTIEEAQAIKDKVFKGFPAIPKFEEDSKRMARELGYVTTLWGRKRRLPDMQLPLYEFKWIPGKEPNDILDFDSDIPDEVPLALQQKYLIKLRQAKPWQKRDIFEQANAEGIWVIDNGKKIADAERQCVNARIQGSAADLTKLAMIKVGMDRQLSDWGFKLLIPVHDELIGECPIENAKICKERFAYLMEEAAYDKLDIPIKCDVAVSREWYGEEIEV